MIVEAVGHVNKMKDRSEYQKQYREKNKEILKIKALVRYEKNKKSLKIKAAIRYQKNKNIYNAKSKKYREDNIEKLKLYDKNYNIKNKEKIKIKGKKYREKNKERISLYLKKYRQNNKEKLSKYDSTRRKTDEYFRLIKNIRSRISKIIKRDSKHSSTLQLLGCSIEYYKKYLLSTLPEALWDEVGSKYHIDHIIPLNTFDLSVPENQYKAFNYTNTRLLLAYDNICRPKCGSDVI